MRVTEIMNERVLLPLIDKWQATGRIAFYHVRKQTVSFDGKQEISVPAAIKKIQDYFGSLNPKP